MIDGIPRSMIPEGATVFQTGKGLATFLRPILARKRNPAAQRALADLEEICTRALGPGVGAGNPDADARILLGRALEKPGSAKSAIHIARGVAVYKAV